MDLPTYMQPDSQFRKRLILQAQPMTTEGEAVAENHHRAHFEPTRPARDPHENVFPEFSEGRNQVFPCVAYDPCLI